MGFRLNPQSVPGWCVTFPTLSVLCGYFTLSYHREVTALPFTKILSLYVGGGAVTPPLEAITRNINKQRK